MFRSLLAVAVAACVFCAPAAASVPDARVATDLKIATAFWHTAPPCPAGVNVVVTDLYGDSGRAAGCVIWLDPSALRQSRSPSVRRRQNAMLCLLIVHESGHLLGHGHAAAAGDVMYPALSDPGLVPGCRPWLREKRLVRRR